ncbi:MAG: cytochrome P460 [Blastocatellia bacterium AA13]|nr:MAG: cytochrome P460 [Blastocatellia bacterium AA13]
MNSMKSIKLSMLAGLAVTCLLLSVLSQRNTVDAQEHGAKSRPAAVFEGQDTMLRPEGYREWVFVGSSTGLSYLPNAPADGESKREDIKHVYIDPFAYREFSRTGKFPEGTVMILEVARAATKNEPGLQGSFAGEYIALEASVKDSKRFPGGWAYFSFTERGGKSVAKAKPFPEGACLSCHQKKAATDHVFTQFYPVLNAARPK